jgi:hypothetical protein
MTVKESIELNVALCYFLRINRGINGSIPSREEGERAAAYLASRANAALMAGLRPSDVAIAFQTKDRDPHNKDRQK